jgi:hypothetical protein
MKKYLVLLCLLCMALTVGAQQVDVKEIDPADIDLTKVDLSDIAFFFNGPLQLYVSGVGYGDQTYAAVLDYSGGSRVTVSAPRVVGTAGKPQIIDLSRASVRVDRSGIRLEGVVVDGFLYSGRLTVTPDNRLAVQSISRGDRVAVPAERLQELEREVTRLETSTKQQDERIARLNRQLEQRPEAEQVTELRGQVRQLEDQVARKNQQVADLQSTAAQLTQEDWETAQERLSRVLASGFRDGSPVYGSWDISARAVTQTDAQRLNAKLQVPVRQDEAELLYTFSGRATGAGWRGYGLHFLASENRSPNGYGYGSSYLVWITRDQAHYQSDTTYVQLYRSYDDVRMVEVASSAVSAPINSRSDLGIYVNRNDQTITVMVNGRAALMFHDDSMIRSGNRVAVRALGTATVEDLRVTTR